MTLKTATSTAVLLIAFFQFDTRGVEMQGRDGLPGEIYGRALPIVKKVGIGATMAARVIGKTLYTIGRGKLCIFDISSPAEPRLLGELGGLGNTRQMTVVNDIAYITSRENGVFIVDVSKPRAPELLCHYDSIEVATGVAISGDVLFIACRLHGVELVDVSNPRKPEHLSVIRAGESQSLAVRNGFAYIGVWGTSELVVADVRNAREPRITARCPLDGYGDGVTVRGSYAYVATGHHSRTKPNRKEGDAGFGRGHGLEIFDISNPAKPEFVSRIKMPPFYRISNDMWSVKVAGDYVFVADTHNGIFVVDISNPRKPRFAAHRQLPFVDKTGLRGFVGGLALTRDYIYVAGGDTDLFVVEAKGLAQPVEEERSTPPLIPRYKPLKHDRFEIYRTRGQVRAVRLLGDVAVVAAGSDGIHLLQLAPRIRKLARYETQGFAMDVAVSGELVLVAEDEGGLSIWRRDGRRSLSLLGRYKPRGKTVRAVVVPEGGRLAMLQMGLSELHIIDIGNEREPRCLFVDRGHGFLYDISERLADGRYACVLWQLGGVRWYDLRAEGAPGFSGDEYPHRLGNNGLVVVDNTAAVIYAGGLLLLKRGETTPPDGMKVVHVRGVALRGKPRLFGNRLYISSRERGDITVLDVSDIWSPRLVDSFNIAGNPSRIVLRDGAMVIPNGYEGLWIEKK